MDQPSTAARRIGHWIQSNFILATARTIYLWVAALSLAAVVIGLIVAAFFEFGALAPASQASLPDLYTPQAGDIRLDTVDAKLSPPRDVRFISTSSPIVSPMSGGEVLGYFTADSPNDLAQFPDDFDILGGKDADLFDRIVVHTPQPRAGLRPTQQFVDMINKALPNLKKLQSRTFSVRVVAHDKYGNRTPPTNISFSLSYGPAPIVSRKTQPSAPQTSDIQQLARDIALQLDPNRTPAYFDAYSRALRVPEQCGGNADDQVFVTDFRVAFQHARNRLNSQNIEAFYAGVCDAWRLVLGKIATSESERARVAQLNATARAEASLRKFGAIIGRNATLMFVLAALLGFMIISLFLAFLAMEGHSRAVRDAVEIFVQDRNESSPNRRVSP